MKKYIMSFVCAGALIVSSATASAGKQGIETTLNDLPSTSRVIEFYKNNARFINTTIVVAAVALLYMYNQDFKVSIKKTTWF